MVFEVPDVMAPTLLHSHVSLPPQSMWPTGAGPTTQAAFTKQQTLMEIMKEGGEKGSQGRASPISLPPAKPGQSPDATPPNTSQLSGKRAGFPRPLVQHCLQCTGLPGSTVGMWAV